MEVGDSRNEGMDRMMIKENDERFEWLESQCIQSWGVNAQP